MDLTLKNKTFSLSLLFLIYRCYNFFRKNVKRMTYLDYSATTPVLDEVMDSFVKASKYIGNPNSLHKLGREANALIEAATRQIASLLKVDKDEIIYTSGASEANNTVIKAMGDYKNRGCEIITTELEHSSIYAPLKYMEAKGFIIKYVPLVDGIVSLSKLEEMISENTVLVTISMVNSETGVRQPIEEIGKMLRKYPKVMFHSDITQALGKIPFSLENVDFASFSAHKFFGIKGIGGLIKKKNIKIAPLIGGGKSTTIYRSGTPPTALIVSMAKALRLSYENMDEDILRIRKLNNKVKDELSKYEGVYINSNNNSIPHILNISILKSKPETFMHSLEEDEVYVSTKSACSSNDISRAVKAVTLDDKKAYHSIRISISRITTEEDIDNFLKAFDKSYRKLGSL